MTRPSRHTVVIIGGGISGLATAWWLHKASVDVLVLERAQRAGGTMQTEQSDGWLVETGPNSALETTPLFQTLFNDLGISEEICYANENSKNRYILRDGTLHPLPLSPGAFFRSSLWSTGGKLRLLREPFVGRSDREETIAEFVERRLGKELLDYAINPFVAGVFAGNPEELSVRAAFPKLYALEQKYGSLIKGQIMGRRERKLRAEQSKDRAKMFSFKKGMETLPIALTKTLGARVKTGVFAKKIDVSQRSQGGRFVIAGTARKSPFSIRANAVVTAIPAAETARLLSPHDASVSAILSGIPYPPVAEIFLGFRTAEIGRSLDGFGFLVPALEKRSILGTIWSSALFPNRAPVGFEALTTFVGGSRQPELVTHDDAELVDMVTRELAHLMGVRGKPSFVRVVRWQSAIPQYVKGHLDAMGRIEQFEHQTPGLFVSGNFRGGISVGDCVMSSERVAQQVLHYLKSH